MFVRIGKEPHIHNIFFLIAKKNYSKITKYYRSEASYKKNIWEDTKVVVSQNPSLRNSDVQSIKHHKKRMCRKIPRNMSVLFTYYSLIALLSSESLRVLVAMTV
jgi:hypothetical protein